MTANLDRRLHVFRPDLADIRLRHRVEARRYAEGKPARIIAPVTQIRSRPEVEIAIDTEALYGERLCVFDRQNGWAWVQLDADGYVGYVRQDAISDNFDDATHLVCVPRSFSYPEADLRLPPVHALSMASRVAVTGSAQTRGTAYALLGDGTAMIAAHLRPVTQTSCMDAVSIAASLLQTPYLWGGRSGFGIDCSGLVQLALTMTGKQCPRDSDQQARNLGVAIDPQRQKSRRGDLVFWKGHVGFLEDPQTLLHASGATMSVTREPLQAAIERIAALYGQPTGYRRP